MTTPMPDPEPHAAIAWTPTLRGRWAELMSTRHSPRRWAIITDAIATADTATADPFGDLLVRGGEDWCRVAFAAMQAPGTVARASQVPDRLPPRCLLDADLLRAWLGAPVAYPGPFVRTVADLVSDQNWGLSADEATQEGLRRLLEAAQDVGVFGVDGYSLELQVTGEDGWIFSHLLIARPEVGPELVSPLLIGGGSPAEPMPYVDSAIAVLSIIAREVDTILDGFDAAHQGPPTPAQQRAAGQAFPPPAAAPGSAQPGGGPPYPPPAPAAPGRRSR